MGLGNGNPTEGDKGSNWRYEYSVLRALECIITNTGTACCPDTNALLIEIRDNTADIEISAETINLNTDDLEACCAAGNVLLTSIDGKLNNNYGAATGALRTASQIGNTTGAADFNAGTTTAQTLRVVLPTDQTAIPITLPSGAQVLTSILATDSTGSPVTAGATSLMFTTSSTFVGTINGIARSASTAYTFEAAQGKTLPAIPYTVTAGSMNIDKLV